MRSRILHATLRVIGEHGVAGLTNRRVAAAAEVSLGTITYHFASQKDLLRDSLQLFVQEETERLAALAGVYTGRDLALPQAAALVEQVLENTTFGHEELATMELLIHAGRDPALAEAADRCFAAYDELARCVLTALAVPDVERLARPVVAMIAGLQLRRLSSGQTRNTQLADSLLMLVSGARTT
jgi:AcrR family transcriptional regulator